MEIITKKLAELNPAAYNPRKALAPGDVEYEQIKQSIINFGMVEPVVWNRRTDTVVAGHQRLTVLRDLGCDEVEVSVIDVDEAKEKALNIALNKITGEWDDAKLTELLEELAADADEMLLGLTGFTDEELAELFAPPDVDEIDADTVDNDFEADPAIADIGRPPITQRGDVYVFDGKHRLVCGDSTSAEDFALLMDGHVAQLTITDPPYNVDYEGVAGKIANDKQADADFQAFLLAAFTNIHGAMKTGAAVYIFHADSEGLNFRLAFERAGFNVRQCLIWAKNSFVMGRQDYQWKHEPILYGWKDGEAHYFVDDRTQSTVIEHDRPTVNKDHPTMKPVALIGRLVKNSSKPGWLVLDPFAGSGSTLMACEMADRVCYAMDIDERYCDVIVRRYINHVDSSAGVYLIRGGKVIPYAEVCGYE